MIEVKEITKTYSQEGQVVKALDNVSFDLPAATSLAICGSSGAGKSTLLSLMGGLDRPTSGSVIVDGQNLFDMNETKEAQFRNQRLGFVFQFHHLLKDFSILENVMMPLLIQKQSKSKASDQAKEILDKVGIGDKVERFPQELSGGEQQRAAIARALIHKPSIILADEPTGNLDEANGERVFELLCHLNRDLRSTLVVVTHHQVFAKHLDHMLVLDGGKKQSLS